ncbi:MAG: glycoside hydrolase family 127 protein [Fimbriimonadaceae bacterium]|nr:glycoside hydrolase family 127 protein [Fimbriimonadaceae bacterium]
MSARSPMRRVPLPNIEVTDPFWSTRQRILAEISLPLQFEHLERTGRLANFRRASGIEPGNHDGLYFNDSDVYKWAEAAALALSHHAHPTLRDQLDQVVTLVESTQLEDGYINTYFQLGRLAERWTELYEKHEMYCIGHLIEAGVSMAESLREDRLLQVAIRAADHVLATFGPNLRPGYCGHPELELALIRLSARTGDARYRDHARWQVESRGHRPSPLEAEFSAGNMRHSLFLKDGAYSGEYGQDHRPIREQEDVVGHAVRAVYLFAAATDLSREDETLLPSLRTAWHRLVTRRMYVTGGIGPSAANEGFTRDFDLPNASAYAETCASIGLMIWGRELLERTGESDYADVIERALYNGVLSGISLDGRTYFYDNPLASDGSHLRREWFHCACCPPNIARTIASVAQYAISETEAGVAIHLPIGLNAELSWGQVQVESNYPFQGKFQIRIASRIETAREVAVRIPDWADEIGFEIDGAEEAAEYRDGYAVITRVWRPDDVLIVDLELAPKWVECHPHVTDNVGRIALTRGPLIYAAESPDLGTHPAAVSPIAEAEIVETQIKGLPGLVALQTEAIVTRDGFPDALYAELGTIESADQDVKFIPYFAWNNRGRHPMAVWMRRA